MNINRRRMLAVFRVCNLLGEVCRIWTTLYRAGKRSGYFLVLIIVPVGFFR